VRTAGRVNAELRISQTRLSASRQRECLANFAQSNALGCFA
jgi:hypothetical protein